MDGFDAVSVAFIDFCVELSVGNSCVQIGVCSQDYLISWGDLKRWEENAN